MRELSQGRNSRVAILAQLDSGTGRIDSSDGQRMGVIPGKDFITEFGGVLGGACKGQVLVLAGGWWG